MGRIPAHWLLHRTKVHFSFLKILNKNRNEKNVLSLTLKGVIRNNPENPEGLVPKDYGTYQRFLKDDLVFKLIDLENLRTSRVGLVPESGIMSSAYLRLRRKKNELVRYFYYQYFDLYSRGVYNQLGAGVRSTLGSTDLLNLSVAVPPSDEQAAIVKFLDWANGRIDRAIRAKKKIISLLNEQKQAIIHQAVTRGLDPNIEMKPSGLPWLGDIPKHWLITRNSALFSHRVEKGIVGLPVLQVSLHSGVTPETFDQFGREKRYISDHSKYKLIRNNDLAYNTMRMWQGAVGVSPTDGLVSPAYVVLTPRPQVYPPYYELLFRTNVYKQQVNRYSTGIVSDRNRLYWESFKQMPNILPPHAEQKIIADAMATRMKSLDTGITHLEKDISFIREYLIRLVSDVVTGKLDINSVAKRLVSEAHKEQIEIGDEDLIENEDDTELTEDTI